MGWHSAEVIKGLRARRKSCVMIGDEVEVATKSAYQTGLRHGLFLLRRSYLRRLWDRVNGVAANFYRTREWWKQHFSSGGSSRSGSRGGGGGMQLEK